MPNSIQPGDLYRIYLTEYDMKSVYFLCCQNMTGDVHYIDVVPHIANGDSDNIGYPGLNKEDLNLTYTSVSPMNFSYPRYGQSAINKGLYAKYDPTCTPFCNVTVNGLGLLDMGGNPTGGRNKELRVEVWFDTNGDYDIIRDTGDVEGIMDFDFDPAVSGIQPYVTKCYDFYGNPEGTYPYGKGPRQAEEFADGVGVWRGGAPGDMNSGQIFVMMYRTDMISDDANNATADFMIYCGFTSKLSWFNLPYPHALVNPNAESGILTDATTFKVEKFAGFNDTLGQAIVRERQDIYFDATHSWDPQDDTGMDGIAFGDPGWSAADTGEGNENIDDGDPISEPTFGEVDNLQYRWFWGVGTQDSGWLSTPYVTHQYTLPAKWPVEIYRVTLMVRDPEMHTDTDYCYVKVWDDPGVAPEPKINIAPDETPKDSEVTMLAGQEFKVSGYAFDGDEGQTMTYYWDLDNADTSHFPDNITEFLGPNDKNGTTEFTMKYSTNGDYLITLNVFDDIVGGDDTLNNTDYYIVHVVNNTAPAGMLTAILANTSMQAVNTSISVRDNQNILFTLDIADPDNRPGFDPNNDYAIDFQMQYKWDFGDGKTVDWTTQKEMTHNYTGKGSANNGYEFYTVTVMARDGPEKNPSTLYYTTAPFKVFVNLPPVAEAGPDLPSIDYEDEIQADDTVQFDGSSSYDPNDDVTDGGNNVIDGTEIDNLKYSWDFGDKSAAVEGKTPTHIYTKGGSYTVQLTVFDTGGRTGTDSLTVTVVEKNKAPVIVVDIYSNVDKTNKMANSAITVMTKEDTMFDASGSYDPDGRAYNDNKNSTLPTDDLQIKWQFSENSTTSSVATVYSYPDNGDYTVTVTITDASHTRKISITQTFTIHVTNRAPLAKINKMETEAIVGQDVIFNGDTSNDADGKVVNYSWDFGDEAKEPFKESSTAMHKYEKPGKYVVKLLVKDDDSDVSTAATINITIKPAPKTGDDGIFGPGFEAMFGILALIGVAVIVTVRKKK